MTSVCKTHSNTRIGLRAAMLARIAGTLFVVGSCAPATPGAAAPESTTSRGTILAARPILPGGAGIGVLNSLAGSAAPAAPGAGQPENGHAIDYIVREASGSMIAVVQTDELHLQVGDPVLIVRGDRTRLARPGT